MKTASKKKMYSVRCIGMSAAILAIVAACADTKNQDSGNTDGSDEPNSTGDTDTDSNVDADTNIEPDTDTDTDADTDTDINTTEDEPDDSGSADFYNLDHVIEVDITMAPEDWDILRYEGRGTAAVVAYCQDEYEYTDFDAEVTIDGEPVDNVSIRKKGFFGSLSALKPSMKLKFDAPPENDLLSGIKGMTLNNDRQDPSHTHQAMSYALFAKAEIAAPRCNFAHVTVNGEDLGIYSNVEPIKKPFLARNFGDAGGNLYEAQGADFSPELVNLFQRKTNTDAASGTGDVSSNGSVSEDGGVSEEDGGTPENVGTVTPDLAAVVDALAADDSELLSRLEAVVNVDGFITFWAMEVILGHWDSYSGNRNNYYVYLDPSTGLFNFIPWGTDGAFESMNASFPDAPVSVYAYGTIANRLYNLPETRKIYQERLKRLLTDLWDETNLLAEVDRIAELTVADDASIQKQITFIEGRKQLILDNIAEGGPEWPYPYQSIARECGVITDIHGTFKALMGGSSATVPDEPLTLEMGWAEGPEILSDLSVSASIGTSYYGTGTDVLFMLSITAVRENGATLMLSLSMPVVLYGEGEVPFHGLETTGMLFEIGADFNILGYVGDGSIVFDEAGVEDGEEVSGSFNGKFAQLIR